MFQPQGDDAGIHGVVVGELQRIAADFSFGDKRPGVGVRNRITSGFECPAGGNSPISRLSLVDDSKQQCRFFLI